VRAAERMRRAGASGSVVLALMLGAAAVRAQQPEHFHPGGRPPEHVDARSAHYAPQGQAHYYPNRGVAVGALPAHAVVINRPTGRYYYAGGVWYAPYGPHYVVVAPPIGVFVPVLPPFYTTLWVGGMPYYYANDTYYTWSQAQNGYQVVDPPNDQGASTQAPQPPPPEGDNLFIYPQNGQSADQQAQDKYECHAWASSQSGFDPTQPGGGAPPEQLAQRRADYQRAMIACLQGRGYSAR